MRLFTLTRFGLGALLLAAGLALASAEELVGTPVPLGDDGAVHIESVHQVSAPVVPEEPVPTPPPHPDWKVELDKGLHEAFGDHNPHGQHDEGGFDAELLIPIIAMLLLFGGPLFLVAYLGTLRYRAKALRQREINANIDKLLAAGRDIPVELLRGDEPKRTEEIGSRDKGIRNLFLGIGWLIFLTLFFGVEIGALGYIWIALGLSQLVIWKLNNPQPNTKATNHQAVQQD